MNIHYCNTKEDFIEINKFIIKNKLYKNISNIKLSSYNMIYYLYYAKYLAFLYCLVGLIYIYIMTKDISYTSTYIFSTIFTSLAGYLFIDSLLSIRLNNSLKKMIKEKPYILEYKTLSIKDSSLEIDYASSKKIQFRLKDISKVVENEYNIYIFLKNYNNFQIIPYSAFKTTSDKNQFIKRLG